MSYRLYLDFKTTIKTIEDLTTIVNHLTEVNHNYQLSLTNDYLIDRIRQTNPLKSAPYSRSRGYQTPQPRLILLAYLSITRHPS